LDVAPPEDDGSHPDINVVKLFEII